MFSVVQFVTGFESSVYVDEAAHLLFSTIIPYFFQTVSENLEQIAEVLQVTTHFALWCHWTLTVSNVNKVRSSSVDTRECQHSVFVCVCVCVCVCRERADPLWTSSKLPRFDTISKNCLTYLGNWIFFINRPKAFCERFVHPKSSFPIIFLSFWALCLYFIQLLHLHVRVFMLSFC